MKRYIGVKFREQGQHYYFWSEQEELKNGQAVIVATEEGQGMAWVVNVRDTPPHDLPEDDIKPIERPAEEEDFQVQEKNRQLGQEAFDYCVEQIQQFKLEMKLVDVEVRFDQSKMVFYFTAPARIDFRELVKVLVSKYRTRIELRQIGVRHEAQLVGGVGNCGRVCCCHSFLRKFDPVTIKMAKEQQLFLNPSKISGACGRLLCCLNYERETYADFQRKCPKIGKRYETALGEVKVLRSNMFRDSLIVDAGEGEEKEISLSEWEEIRKRRPRDNPPAGDAPKRTDQSGDRGEPRSQPGPKDQPGPEAAQPEGQEQGQGKQGHKDSDSNKSKDKRPRRSRKRRSRPRKKK